MKIRITAIVLVAAGCLTLAAPLLTQATSQQEGAPPLFEAYSPFWLPGGATASAVVNNPLGEAVPFTFEVRDSDGNTLHSGEEVIEPNGSRAIPLRDLLPQTMRTGYCVIRYPEEFAGSLPAQLIQLDPESGIAVNHLFGEGLSNSASDMRAPFWLPTPLSDVYLMLLNRADTALVAEMTVRNDKGQDRLTRRIEAGTLQTLRLSRFLRLPGGSKEGAIQLTHSGQNGELVARAFVMDEKAGFSYALDFLDGPAEPAATTDTGAKALNLPMIRYGVTESGIHLTPYLAVSNELDRPLDVSLLLRHAGSGVVALDPLTLHPRQVRMLNLGERLRKALGRPEPLLEASLDLTYDGAQGGLTVTALSLDDSFDHVYQSKVKPTNRLESAYSFPFDIRSDWNTKVYLTNRSQESTQLCLFFNFNGQFYTYPLAKFLEPSEFRVVDVKEIRDRKIADEFGRVLPPDVEHGQIKLIVHSLDHSVITAQAVVENPRLALSMPFSCSICGPSESALYLRRTYLAPPGTTATYVGAVGSQERIFAIVEFTDGNIKDASTAATYKPMDKSIADVVKAAGRADVVFKKLGYTDLEASLQGCQQRVEVGTCEPLAGGGRYCECDCEPITVTVPGYFGLSPSAQVLVNQVETDEIVVVAWVDKTPISLPSGANPFLVVSLNDPTGLQCGLVVGAWAAGTPQYLFTQLDIDYANAFLLRNSANSNPGVSINPTSVENGGDYRMFNRLKIRVTSFEDQVQAYLINGASTAVVGNTPNPCVGLLPSSSPETHPLNRAAGVTANGLRVYQLNQGRVGTIGQGVDRTLNYPTAPPGSGTPWIWSAIKFNADGTFAPLDHQIFPTYYVYRNGTLIGTFPQSAPSTFISLTSSSQRSLGQIN